MSPTISTSFVPLFCCNWATKVRRRCTCCTRVPFQQPWPSPASRLPAASGSPAPGQLPLLFRWFTTTVKRSPPGAAKVCASVGRLLTGSVSLMAAPTSVTFAGL